MEIDKFFSLINTLKHSEREGWKRIGVTGTKDTIASHSFGACLLGMHLAKLENVDCDKVVKLLIVHDLIMKYVPDSTPLDAEYSDKRKLEYENVEKLLLDIPKNIRDEFRALIIEYLDETSKEVIVARQADKLDTLLTVKEYSKDLGQPEIFKEFLENDKGKFKTDIGKKLFEEIQNL